MVLTFLEITFVCTFLVALFAKTFLLVPDKVANILCFRCRIESSTLPEDSVVRPNALVHGAIHDFEYTVPMSSAQLPGPLVSSAVSKYHRPLAMSEASEPFTIIS